MELVRTEAETGLISLSEEAKIDGPAWLKELQETARAEFQAKGLPNRRVEEWKYTDLKSAMKVAFKPVDQGDVTEAQINEQLGAELAAISTHKLVFVDGQLNEQLSDCSLGELSEVLSLKAALADDVSWVQSIGTVQQNERDAVQALNLALMQGGAAIKIADRHELNKPIHLIFVSTATSESSVASRLFFEIGAAAKVEIIESHISLEDKPSQTNLVTEVLVGDWAKVRHVKFTNDHKESVHLSNVIGKLGKEADYGLFQATLDGGLTRNQVEIRYDGDEAKADISGVALLSGKSHADLTLVMDHAALSCESRELFKTVLDDEGRAVFQGKVIVQPGAQKTDGEMMSKALLLSETAEFDSKPELEIYADDVLCGHGATTGQIDDDLLFYLKARGVPDEEARSLLIQAFVGEALELIENDDLRDYVINQTLAWYEKA
ncbi:MAG: Fe-S cluster assembly protein SufD [Rhizobiales bacterium]|nr:Fe-S cluster assembly protein SufD [Hyphomicrobiales bacterium]